MKSIRLLSIIIVSILLVGDVSAVQAQTGPAGGCRYFPDTGHYVCGRFLDLFERKGGLRIFGYPLTEAFVDPTHNGLRVQYFQRARMEEHPGNQPPYDVQLGLLVDELGYTYPPTHPNELPSADDPAQHYFPETQHVVSYAFLDFFRDKGGLYVFGYPRSEMVYEEGLVVQYFQRARMEWHRDNPPGQQIILTKVGEVYIERFGVPGNADGALPHPAPRRETSGEALTRPTHQAYLPHILANTVADGPSPSPESPSPTATSPTEPRPVTPSPTVPSANVTRLDVSASVRYPITGRTGTQTTFVYVNDPEGRPIAGADVSLVVHYQSGDTTCVAKPTDASGFTRCSFDIPSPPVGKKVVIDVKVTYQGLTGTTQTFFMPWW